MPVTLNSVTETSSFSATSITTSSQSYTSGRHVWLACFVQREDDATMAFNFTITDSASTNTITWTERGASGDLLNSFGTAWASQVRVFSSSELTATESFTITLEGFDGVDVGRHCVLVVEAIGGDGTLEQAAGFASAEATTTSVSLGSAPAERQMIAGFASLASGTRTSATAPTDWTDLGTATGAVWGDSIESSTNTGTSETWGISGGQTYITCLAFVEFAEAATATDFEEEEIDTVGITDTVERAVDVERSTVDDVGITDAVTFAKGATAETVDTVGIVDSIEAVTARLRTAADTVGITDTVDHATEAERSAEAWPVGITDTVEATLSKVRAEVDTVGISDTVETASAATRAEVDEVGILDTVEHVLAAVRALADTVGITDAMARTATAARTATDTVGISDTVTPNLTSDGAETVTESVGISDTVVRTLEQTRTVVDTVGILDTLETARAINRDLVDLVGLLDTASGSISSGLVEAIVEAIGITDQVVARIDAVRTVVDPVGLSDQMARAMSQAREITDSLGITDTVTISGVTLGITAGVEAVELERRYGITALERRHGTVALVRSYP